MKYTVLTLAATFAAASAFAQGTVAFGNRVTSAGIDAPVTDSTGAKIDGAAGWAQLLAGPAGGALAPVGDPVNFRSGAAAGYITTVTVPVPTVAAGSPADLQMVAWDAAVGGTYDAAMASGMGGMGASGVLSGITTGGAGSPPSLPANMTGLTAFSIAPVVPEPSIAALGLLGAGLLVIRRKK